MVLQWQMIYWFVFTPICHFMSFFHCLLKGVLTQQHQVQIKYLAPQTLKISLMNKDRDFT